MMPPPYSRFLALIVLRHYLQSVYNCRPRPFPSAFAGSIYLKIRNLSNILDFASSSILVLHLPDELNRILFLFPKHHNCPFEGLNLIALSKRFIQIAIKVLHSQYINFPQFYLKTNFFFYPFCFQ